MGYFPWLVSSKLIWRNLIAWLGKEKCLMQRLGMEICQESVLDCQISSPLFVPD